MYPLPSREMPATKMWPIRQEILCGIIADLTDKQDMKTPAVSYAQSLAAAVSDAARITPRHGGTAYGLSVFLAIATLIASIFFKEITHTYGQDFMGFSAAAFWRGMFLAGALLWVISTVLGLLCMPQEGLTRRLGTCSVSINVAAAILAACALF